MDIDDKIKKERNCRKMVFMRKMCKYAVSIVACIVLLATVSSVGTYVLSGRTIWDIFFKTSKMDYAKELLDYNGQKYIIDDYTIILEQTLYDSKTNIGYCVFSITKIEEKPEAELNKWGQTPGERYGENGRFRIEDFASQSVKFEYIGDVLYQYVSFRADNEFDLTIRLLDENSESEILKHYEFYLTESHKYKEYKISDTENLIISPLGVAINSGSNIGDSFITLHYKDGEETNIIDSANGIGIGNSRISNNNGQYQYQYVFKKITDIQKVEYIIYNGEKYEEID